MIDRGSVDLQVEVEAHKHATLPTVESIPDEGKRRVVEMLYSCTFRAFPD